MNLFCFMLQAGRYRLWRAFQQAYRNGTLDDLLTSTWFWVIVIFCLVCVVIYKLKEER